MYKYEIIIYWSNEDNVFVAEIPELPGCTAHGDSQNEALKNANEAISLWIETAQNNNMPIPKPKGGPLIFA